MTETQHQPGDPPLSHRDALAAGTHLAEFEFQGLLGVGGFGMVYRALDHSLRRGVAIKEFMPSGMAGRTDGLTVAVRSSADHASFQAGLRSFVAEAQLLAQFDHPSLVKVFRIWEANNTAYMVMPLYTGITLKQANEQMTQPPPEAWLRKFLWSLTEALKVLHNGKTMHRDISPDNIFLQDIGPPVLLDLGAARRAIKSHSHQHTAILKVNYAPIEQYGDSPELRQGPWTDLYALAAVVYGCVARQAPPPATYRVLDDRMPPFEQVAVQAAERFQLNYSEAFVSAISAALAIRPEQRTPRVSTFAETMALLPVPGMDEFDWRAELGGNALAVPSEGGTDVWGKPLIELPADASGTHSVPNSFANAAETVQLDTIGPASESDWQATAMDNASAMDPPDVPPKEFTQTRRALALLALVTLSLMAYGMWRWLSAGTPSPATPNISATSPAGPSPLPSASAPVNGVVAAPLAPNSATEPVNTAAVANKSTAAPNPASSASAPLNKKQAAPASSAASTPAVTPTPAASAPLHHQPDTVAPASTHPKADTPAAKVSASISPSEQCADSNVFTRPWCLHKACESPEQAGSAFCTDLRERQRSNSNLNDSPR